MYSLNKSVIVSLSGLISILLLLTGCGGGGGGNSGGNDGGSSGNSAYSISLDQTSVDFSGTTDGDYSKSIIVKVQFKGDGVIVGYPPNIPEASWLTVTTNSSSATTATFEIRAFWGTIPGNYNTTLRFVTGKADGSNLKHIDLPVKLSVKEGFSAVASEGHFVTQFDFQSKGHLTSTISPVNYQINIVGDDSDWKIASDPWINVDKSSGKGKANIKVSVNPATASYGDNEGKFTITDSVSKRSFEFKVNYKLVHADVSVDTRKHHFLVNESTPANALTSSFQIVDSLQGVSEEDIYTWSLVSSSADWVSLENTSGSTKQGQPSPKIVIDKNALLENPQGENYKAKLTLKTQGKFAPAKEYTIDVEAFISVNSVAETSSTPYIFNYSIDRAAFSPAAQQLFIADKNAKKLYVVDTKTGQTTQSYSFEQMPESLSVSPNGQYLFVALLIHEHDYFQANPGGKIAVIDLHKASMVNKFDTSLDPWDIAGTDSAEVYVSGGSGQWTQINRYKGLSGELDIFGHSRHRISLALSPDQQSVYSVTTDLSPGDITRYSSEEINGNKFLNGRDSPYHGDYNIGNKIWFEPSGKALITEWGNVFKADDLTFIKLVPATSFPMQDIAFDTTNNRVLMIERELFGEPTKLVSYDLPNYDNYKTIKQDASNGKFIFSDNGTILYIEKTTTGFQLTKL